MLHVHFANRAETLRDLLLQQLDAEPPGVFDSPTLIVPSAAMQRWLTLSLARRHGVCAHVGFAYLAQWLWQQIARAVPGVGEASPFDPTVLAWRIHAAFGDAAWATGQPRLAAYLERADPVMRLDLAVRVAGLFDQYITYRADWLDTWSRGGRIGLGPGAADDETWQAALWRRLAAEVGAPDGHPALALARLLADGTAAPAAGAHVFCLPTMAPMHLGLLQALAAHVDIHVYALNPCREHWFEVVSPRRLAALAARGQAQYFETGQRLLAAWGQQAQSQLGLLVDAAGDAVVDDEHFEDLPGTHLLARLHNAVLAMQDPAPGAWPLRISDRSIEVHVCHSLTREIEVLHDTLLALFASPAAPAALSDVLVVLPDLDAAAPLIDAVFGTAPRERFIPYTITGRARSTANPAARLLLELLALADSRLPVSAVLALLQQPMVARRFGVDDEALTWVRDALRDAGVHWGLDAAHQARAGLPASGAHTLADGLDRLYLGYALPEDSSASVDGPLRAATFDGRLPAGQAEGSDAAALGAWWSFVEALAALQRAVAAPLPAAEWPALLSAALARFGEPLGSEIEDTREVADAIDALAREFAHSALAEPLPLAVVRAALTRALDTPARGGVPTGTLTFSNLAGLRGLPYAVICVLGLNDGEFPSRTRAPEFDLIAQQPRRGDRQRRDDERCLFLDLLLAARERLHLSFVGRSVRDNTALSPSVLVSELLELLVPAIADAPGDPAALARAWARLVVEHPLQPFSRDAFRVDGDPRRRSFRSDFADALKGLQAAPAAASPASAGLAGLGDAGAGFGAGAATETEPAAATSTAAAAAAAAATLDDADDAGEFDDDGRFDPPAVPFFTTALALPADVRRELTLDQLVRFFRNPCRALLQTRLGLTLREDDDDLLDDEPLVASPAGLRALAERLLPLLLAGAGPAEVRAMARAGTELPAGVFGERWLARELAGLQAFAGRIIEATGEPGLPPHTASLHLPVGGAVWRLDAAFSDLRASGLLHHRYGTLNAADRIAAWLHHLVLCASAPAGVQPLTTWHASDATLRLHPPADPTGMLCGLLALYEHGLQAPLAFFPKSAWAYVDKDDSLSAALAAWRPSAFQRFAEGTHLAYRLALRGRPDPFGPGLAEFHALAHAVYDPLRDHAEERPA
jgi:exodeoxyribonuclease V gamma subunit